MNGKAVRIRSGKLGRIKPGHPWIYKNQLLKIAGSAPSPGSIVTVTDPDGKLIGSGYYNPRSAISIRLLTFKDEPVDKDLLAAKISAAVEKRKALSGQTNAYRAVFSEADGLPGLIVDVYNDTAVFQVLTLGMEGFKDILMDLIREEIHPKYLYEKSVSAYRKLEGLKDSAGWRGEQGNGVVEISEGGAKFLVDIENGHKTGFYLDQRNSRIAIRQYAKGTRVLDLFCYTGGFSVNAALAGAGEVTGIDIKDDWLEFGRKNSENMSVI